METRLRSMNVAWRATSCETSISPDGLCQIMITTQMITEFRDVDICEICQIVRCVLQLPVVINVLVEGLYFVVFSFRQNCVHNNWNGDNKHDDDDDNLRRLQKT